MATSARQARLSAQRARVIAVSAAPGAIGSTVMTLASASPPGAPAAHSPYACSLRAGPQLGPRFRPLRLVRRLPFRPVPFRGNLSARQASDNPKHKPPLASGSFAANYWHHLAKSKFAYGFGKPSINMMRPWLFGAFIACMFGSSEVGAAQFTSGDWAVACDNTGRCRAAGYEPASQIDHPIVLAIEREAGPGTPVFVTLVANWSAHNRQDQATLALAGGASVKTEGGFKIPFDAFTRLLPRLLSAYEANVLFAGHRGTLSLDGVKAVLLKFDDLQGRVGTPGAFVAKGDRPETTVPKAIDPPVVHPAQRVSPRAGDAALLREILPHLGADCDISADGMVEGSSITRVAHDRVVVLQACTVGQHDFSRAIWLVDDRYPFTARRLGLPDIEGNVDDLPYGASFDGQTMHISIRDDDGCENTRDWVWTGESFVLAEVDVTLLCRNVWGGPEHRVYTTRR
jgi:hypothetical protein